MSDAKIEHRIGVKAPPLVIWEMLVEVESWPSWNPIYTEARGRLGFDEPLHLTCQLPDRPPFPIEATVTEWVPEEQILWTTRSKYGFVRTTRYIEIDKLSDNGCIFANGELIQGRMAASHARKMGRALYLGFEAMGEAVKARAEAIWAQRSGATT